MEEVDFFSYFVLLAFAKTSNNNKKNPQTQNQTAKPMSAKASEVLQSIIAC